MDLCVPSAARPADALRPVLLFAPGAVGMHLDAGAVEAEALRVLADRFLIPKGGEQPPEHAAAGPAAEPGVTADQLPKRSGSVRHLQPFSKTYRSTLMKTTFEIRTFPS